MLLECNSELAATIADNMAKALTSVLPGVVEGDIKAAIPVSSEFSVGEKLNDCSIVFSGVPEAIDINPLERNAADLSSVFLVLDAIDKDNVLKEVFRTGTTRCRKCSLIKIILATFMTHSKF